MLAFMHDRSGFEPNDNLDWFASCCEAYSEWRRVLESKCERHIQPKNGIIKHEDLRELRDVLQTYTNLPEFMRNTLACLTANAIKDRPTTDIIETHQVAYHKPSCMFNATQLDRLASPQSHVYCVNSGNVHCDNYVEVRDFSQVFHHVVLAHKTLLPWALVTREGRQFNFHAPLGADTSEPHHTFLPTYFGSMKILPNMPSGQEVYARVDRWGKFRTAAQIDEAAGLRKRTILRVKGPSLRLPDNSQVPGEAASPELSMDMDVEPSMLTQRLEVRGQVRAQARPPAKKNTNVQRSEPAVLAAKRSRPLESTDEPVVADTPPQQAAALTTTFMDRALFNLERQAQGQTAESPRELPRAPEVSFCQREENANLLEPGPPLLLVANNETFTITSDDSFDLEHDIRQNEKWLSKMGNGDNGSGEVAGLFGFNFHHSLRREGDESDTEEETPLAGKAEERPGAPVTDVLGSPQTSMLTRHRERVSQSFALDASSGTLMDTGNEKAVSQPFSGRLDLERIAPLQSSGAQADATEHAREFGGAAVELPGWAEIQKSVGDGGSIPDTEPGESLHADVDE